MLYDNILEVLNNYYGLDAMQKVYTKGVEIGLKGNTQWGRYYKQLAEMTPDIVDWKTKSGKSVGLWSIRGTQSVPSASLVPTTKNTLTTIDMAMGTEVGEYAGKQLPKLVTAGGTSGSTSIGSFVVGEVLPAIGAAACGVVLGVAVDKWLYEANPYYWDEKLPTLNPETWDDIILGHDTKIPFLHNTENGKTYLKEDFLLYNALLGKNENWFNNNGVYYVRTTDYEPLKNDRVVVFNQNVPSEYLNYNGHIATASVDKGVIFMGYDTVLYVAMPTYNTPRATSTVPELGKNNTRNCPYYGGNTINGKEVWVYNMFCYGNVTGIEANTTSNSLFDSAYIALYGNEDVTHGGNLPKGVNRIGVTPDLSNISSFSDIQNKLRQTYPDLYNNSLDIPFYDVDTDTTTTNKWIPVTIPTDFLNTDDNIINKPNNKPVSTNLNQSNDGSYPDNDTENKAKENTITEGSIPSTPDNIDPINPILPSEDSPNIIVPDTNIDNGLGAVYVPTIEQLVSFSQWLWSPNFIEQIKKLFSDPMQGIIGLHQIYFTPEHNGTDTIHCGYLDSGVSSDYTKKRYIKINCGSVNIKETFGNIFDYEPLTTIECYLPFIGIVPLKVGDVMRSTISIEYICDVLTGACLCNIYVLRDDIKALLYTYGGNCAVNYPLSSGSYMGIVSSLVGVTMSVATGIISGGASIPLSIGGGAMSLLNAKTNVKTSGGYGGNTGAMGVKKPYLIIKNTLTSMPNNYNKYIGNAYNDIKNISECVGYSVIENVQLIGEMTDTEKEEIKNYLESGVII